MNTLMIVFMIAVMITTIITLTIKTPRPIMIITYKRFHQ